MVVGCRRCNLQGLPNKSSDDHVGVVLNVVALLYWFKLTRNIECLFGSGANVVRDAPDAFTPNFMRTSVTMA